MRPQYFIIVAAGSGRRFGSELPKQFCLLEGKPVLMHTVSRLHEAIPEAKIMIVLHPDYEEYWAGVCSDMGFTIPHTVVHGGATRSYSVRNALKQIHTEDNSFVYVHDGARPLTSRDTIQNVAEALQSGHKAAVPAIQPTDSMRELCGNKSIPVDRSKYLAVQTPQGFDSNILMQAYNADDAATDDASLVQNIFPDIDIAIVPGSPYNIKITNPMDIAIAESILRQTLNE